MTEGGQSEVVAVAEAWKRQLEALDAETMRAMGDEWLRVERVLQVRAADIAKQIETLRQRGEQPSAALLMESAEYQRLLAELQLELRRYTAYASEQIEGATEESVGMAGEAAQAELWTARPELRIRYGHLPVEAVETMLATTRGGPLNELLRQTWGDAATGLENALKDAIAQGTNPRETARAMAQGAGGAADRMLTIARSEQLRAYRITAVDSYRRSGLVYGYKRLAARSPRTCLGCLAADGEVYRLEEEFGDHPAGRCSCVALVQGAPEPTWDYGREWLAAQPDEVQEQIMGAGVFALWKSTGLPIEAMWQRSVHKTWGENIRPRTLDELKGLLQGGRAPKGLPPQPRPPRTSGPVPSVSPTLAGVRG